MANCRIRERRETVHTVIEVLIIERDSGMKAFLLKLLDALCLQSSKWMPGVNNTLGEMRQGKEPATLSHHTIAQDGTNVIRNCLTSFHI